jgi:hypothetical protein
MSFKAGDLFLCVVIENSLFISFVAKQIWRLPIESHRFLWQSSSSLRQISQHEPVRLWYRMSVVKPGSRSCITAPCRYTRHILSNFRRDESQLLWRGPTDQRRVSLSLSSWSSISADIKSGRGLPMSVRRVALITRCSRGVGNSPPFKFVGAMATV